MELLWSFCLNRSWCFFPFFCDNSHPIPTVFLKLIGNFSFFGVSSEFRLFPPSTLIYNSWWLRSHFMVWLSLPSLVPDCALLHVTILLFAFVQSPCDLSWITEGVIIQKSGIDVKVPLGFLFTHTGKCLSAAPSLQEPVATLGIFLQVDFGFVNSLPIEIFISRAEGEYLQSSKQRMDCKLNIICSLCYSSCHRMGFYPLKSSKVQNRN